jgi:aspartate/methionine/tyrosine aminotransferase
MFVWASVPTGYKDGFVLSDELLYKAGVFITPGGIFGSAGNRYIRISLCSPVSVFEKALKKISEAKK